MTVTEAVGDVYLRATGKTPAPTSGTKYNRIIGLLNYYQRRWGRQKGIDWNSLYNSGLSLGTVTATDTFDIDTSTVRKLSDREGDTVRIVWSDGVGYTDYTIVDPDTLKDYSWGVNKESYTNFYCARMGSELVFNHTFATTDAQFGGTIYVPCFVFPDDITAATADQDDVQVDDPDWLTTRVAAEYVRNDIVRRPRFPELMAEQKEIMDRMMDDNDSQVDKVDMPWTPGVPSDSAWS